MTKAEKLDAVIVAARKIRAGVEDRHAMTTRLQQMAAEARRNPDGESRARSLEIKSVVEVVSLDEAIYELVRAIERYDGRRSSEKNW